VVCPCLKSTLSATTAADLALDEPPSPASANANQAGREAEALAVVIGQFSASWRGSGPSRVSLTYYRTKGQADPEGLPAGRVGATLASEAPAAPTPPPPTAPTTSEPDRHPLGPGGAVRPPSSPLEPRPSRSTLMNATAATPTTLKSAEADLARALGSAAPPAQILAGKALFI
jgi:hypothetical protein